MSSENEHADGLQRSFARSLLPWLVLVGGLALYLATLNRWITLTSLGFAARLGGWDWQPALTAPLHFVLTYPLRFLPAHLQPVALNAFSAVCAALTLAMLARAVALLPQDRTREQRLREQGDYALLSVPGAWIPPLIAVLACGLQSGFWEHAVTGSGEMLDLLMIAYIVRCLTEYRVRENDAWLVKMSFAYGLATTNNWAMIGLLPVTLAALIWLKGSSFFNARFFLKMLGAGLAGLLLYLLLPLLALRQDQGGLSFWTALTIHLGQQKQALLYREFRLPFMLAGTVSLLPLLLLAVRWPSSLGDVNPLSNLFSSLMFRVVHLGFFVVGIVVLYRPDFLAAQFDNLGVPFLSLTFLAALCIGYFAGYLLLIFGIPASRAWSRPNILEKVLNKTIVAAIFAAVVIVPALFVTRNLPRIKSVNSPVLLHFATRLAQSVPANTVLLSDQQVHLWLLSAYYAREQKPLPLVPINTVALSYRIYHEYLLRAYPDLWEPLPRGPKGEQATEPISPLYLVHRMAQVSQLRKIYYAHSSFGYYFEIFQPHPNGLALEMRPDLAFALPRMTPEEIERNLNFWKTAAPELDLAVTSQYQDAKYVARTVARTLNFWGTLLQQNNRLPEAAAAFNRAAKLNPDNVVAKVNLDFNAQLQNQKRVSKVSSADVDRNLQYYRGWDKFLAINGPFDDPVYGFFLGQLLASKGNNRQAAQLFLRCKELTPNSIEADLMLGQVYLQAGNFAELTQLIRSSRQSALPLWKDDTNRLELVRLEALAFFAQTNLTAGEEVLQAAIRNAPSNSLVLAVAANVYLTRNMTSNALAIIERQLQLSPDNPAVLLNKAVVLMQQGQFAAAIVPLSRLLEKAPSHYPARMNRAIAYLQLKKLTEAQRDYEFLRQSKSDLFAVYFGLGEIAYQKQDKRAAIKHYESYLKYAPAGTQERRDVEARLKKLKES